MANLGGMPFLARETRLLFLLTFAICVVVPHSMQEVTAGLLGLTAVASLMVVRGSGRISYIGGSYLLAALVTCVYLIVGMRNGAPTEAVYQTIFIYIIMPLIWILIANTALHLIGLKKMVSYLVVLAWLCCASVALFFSLYFTLGADAVKFFIEAPNINISEGFSGATMNVYGSLIFLSAAVFSSSELIENKAARIALLGALAICALTSGRTALILSIPAGFLIGILVRHFNRNKGEGVRADKPRWGRYFLSFAAVAGVVLLLDLMVEAVDLGTVLQAFWEKLSSGGGQERAEQNIALWQGIRDTYGLGGGHGIGVALTRNALYPWRYENVPLAILFKTGVLGATIYALPFFIYLFKALRMMMQGRLAVHDKFMFAGFSGVLLAAPTNPYFESFIFQWMIILPLVSLERTAGSSGRMRE